jgi:hypothetical protein
MILSCATISGTTNIVQVGRYLHNADGQWLHGIFLEGFKGNKAFKHYQTAVSFSSTDINIQLSLAIFPSFTQNIMTMQFHHKCSINSGSVKNSISLMTRGGWLFRLRQMIKHQLKGPGMKNT